MTFAVDSLEISLSRTARIEAAAATVFYAQTLRLNSSGTAASRKPPPLSHRRRSSASQIADSNPRSP